MEVASLRKIWAGGGNLLPLADSFHSCEGSNPNNHEKKFCESHANPATATTEIAERKFESKGKRDTAECELWAQLCR